MFDLFDDVDAFRNRKDAVMKTVFELKDGGRVIVAAMGPGVMTFHEDRDRTMKVISKTLASDVPSLAELVAFNRSPEVTANMNKLLESPDGYRQYAAALIFCGRGAAQNIIDMLNIVEKSIAKH